MRPLRKWSSVTCAALAKAASTSPPAQRRWTTTLPGAAFFAPATSGDFAPLYCVSPDVSTAIPVRRDKATNRWIQDNVACGDTFTPSQSNIFIRKLTFTISIGSDF